MRKPLTGTLSMKIHQVKDIDHAATGRFARGPETWVSIKVEDTLKGKTRPSRVDKWTDEPIIVDIEKANEIELTVYDKIGPQPTPIAMLWIRISDIAEEMRRKKIEMDLGNSQWVTADNMDNGGNQSRQDSAYSSVNNLAQDRSSRGPAGREAPANLPAQSSADPMAIEAWFALEPVGRIHVTMSFSD